jgi:hypothetical protein
MEQTDLMEQMAHYEFTVMDQQVQSQFPRQAHYYHLTVSMES